MLILSFSIQISRLCRVFQCWVGFSVLFSYFYLDNSYTKWSPLLRHLSCQWQLSLTESGGTHKVASGSVRKPGWSLGHRPISKLLNRFLGAYMPQNVVKDIHTQRAIKLSVRQIKNGILRNPIVLGHGMCIVVVLPSCCCTSTKATYQTDTKQRRQIPPSQIKINYLHIKHRL